MKVTIAIFLTTISLGANCSDIGFSYEENQKESGVGIKVNNIQFRYFTNDYQEHAYSGENYSFGVNSKKYTLTYAPEAELDKFGKISLDLVPEIGFVHQTLNSWATFDKSLGMPNYSNVDESTRLFNGFGVQLRGKFYENLTGKVKVGTYSEGGSFRHYLPAASFSLTLGF